MLFDGEGVCPNSIHEFIERLLSRSFLVAAFLLEENHQPFALPANGCEIFVSQVGPLLFDLVTPIFPIARDLVPTHRICRFLLPYREIKKADMAAHLEVFRHVGLLINAPTEFNRFAIY